MLRGYSGLFCPVFQREPRHPLKLPHLIRHQHDTGGYGVPGNRAESFGSSVVPAAALISVVAATTARSQGSTASRLA